METEYPIGIFDSGVGGLSITHAIRETLPSENIIYVADLGFSPYGNKSPQMIEQRSEYIVEHLLNRGCKAIVVACNTATVNAISQLRAKFDIPIIGVEPGIKPAAQQSRTGVIGVLATQQTIESQSFQLLKQRFSDTIKIESQACPKLVELVESGCFDDSNSTNIVSDYVLPLLSKGADQIILGCTHYSFLTPVIERIVQDKATIIDTAMPVAVELKNRLSHFNLLQTSNDVGHIQFCSTSISDEITQRVSHLWGSDVQINKL